MLVRFVANREGIFRSAYDLLASESLDAREHRRLQAKVEWFERYLSVPKGRAFERSRAVCWFKQEGRWYIWRAWRLAIFLKERGYCVEMIRTKKPGYVTYEDAFQVVAIPFADTM
jgi:hypothetical protein